MAQRKRSADDGKTQHQRFVELAHKVGADASEDIFDRALRGVGKSAPQKAKKAAAKRKR